MASKHYSNDEIKDIVLRLPFHDLKKVLDHYIAETGVNFNK